MCLKHDQHFSSLSTISSQSSQLWHTFGQTRNSMSTIFALVCSLGDKIWRQCICGTKKVQGYCCPHQPWEHAYCAVVNRGGLPPLLTNASAPARLRPPVNSTAPDAVTSPYDAICAPTGISTHAGDSSPAPASASGGEMNRLRTHTPHGGDQYEAELGGPLHSVTQGQIEIGSRAQQPLSLVEVSSVLTAVSWTLCNNFSNCSFPS